LRVTLSRSDENAIERDPLLDPMLAERARLSESGLGELIVSVERKRRRFAVTDENEERHPFSLSTQAVESSLPSRNHETMAVTEEVLVAFRGGATRSTVPVTTQFRSTWLSSSLRALRERKLIDQYLAYLPEEHHEAVLTTVVGVWLPSAIAVAHYEACDRLGLTEAEQLSIGSEVGKHAQGTVFSVAVNLAKGAGVTPWTLLARLPGVWERIWVGGGVAIVKLGPKEARVEIGGWQCSRVSYTRVAMRGVIAGLVDLFSAKAYVRQLTPLCTALTLGYRISWA
jgi:hypothetical protein